MYSLKIPVCFTNIKCIKIKFKFKNALSKVGDIKSQETQVLNAIVY